MVRIKKNVRNILLSLLILVLLFCVWRISVSNPEPGNISLQNVYLIMVASVDNNAAVLSHHLSHYMRAGILPENFVIALDSLKKNEAAMAFWTNFYKERGVTVEQFPFPFNSCTKLEWQVDALARRGVTTDKQWVIPTDADEMIQFPGEGDVLSFVRQVASDGANYAYGIFADRVTADGTLRNPVEGISIEEQFPLLCHIAGNIAHGETQKVVLHRGDLRAGTGHHSLWFYQRMYKKLSLNKNCPSISNQDQVPSIRGIPWRWGGERIPVNHYKWTDGVVENLKHRMEFGVNSWTSESKALLSHITDDNRICVECEKLKCRNVSPSERHSTNTEAVIAKLSERIKQNTPVQPKTQRERHHHLAGHQKKTKSRRQEKVEEYATLSM